MTRRELEQRMNSRIRSLQEEEKKRKEADRKMKNNGKNF